MQGENRNKIEENKKVVLPLYLRRFWADQQRKFSQAGMAIILFDALENKNRYWRFHLASSGSTSLNEQLKNVFLAINSSTKNLEAFLKTIFLPKGYFIPKSELLHLEKGLLQKHLIVTNKFLHDFPFTKYLQSIKKDNVQSRISKSPLPIVGIWHFLNFYVGFLKHIKTTDLQALNAYRQIIHQPIAITKFSQLLPSEQLTLSLLMMVELYFCDNFSPVDFDNLIDKSTPDVQNFWKTWQTKIQNYLNHCFVTPSLKFSENIFTRSVLQQTFYNVWKSDIDCIRIQEILDNSSHVNYIQKLPETIQEKYQPQDSLSVAQKMKKVIGSSSILDRIQSMKENTEPQSRPHFFPIQKKWLATDESFYWYELTTKEQKELLDTIKNSLTDIHSSQLEEVVQYRYSIFLENFSNKITAPFIFWKKEKKDWFPQINLLNDKQANQLDDIYERKTAKERKELIRLEKVLEQLYKYPSVFAVQEYSERIGKFKVPFVQEKWQRSYEEYLSKLQNKVNFRHQKMREYGILEKGEQPSFRKEIWLDELLSIEKEVSPYISFVKRAFQGALPMQKTVEFNPFRHSMDGVEFDPETIQDHEKWMNGEVMKSLRVKVDKQPVEQINAFALDSSGSMKHEKMRNLFKLCYLMVMGLEERKTYDSFHLFGTDFIETANFTHRYTNRTLLFKILLKIARIKNSKVEYKGSGGTNISEGIFQCHDRIQEFAKQLKAKNPNTQHLTSIFVITDGEPSAGIMDVNKLNEAIEEKRKISNIAIKGIYLKPKGEEAMFMESVFGKNQYVETVDFNNALEQFVYIMALTYKKQRKELKRARKLQKLKRK